VGIKDQSGLTIFLIKTAESLAGQKITLTIQVDNVESKYQELANLGVKFVSPPKRQFGGYGAESNQAQKAMPEGISLIVHL